MILTSVLTRRSLLVGRTTTLIARQWPFLSTPSTVSIVHGGSSNSIQQLLEQHRCFGSSGKNNNLALLKDLRAKTGAPLGECRKALEFATNEATEGEDDDALVSAAMDWLRKQGAAKAMGKLSGRSADDGLVGCMVKEDGSAASMVVVASETDFAAKSLTFVELVRGINEAALSDSAAATASAEDLLTVSHQGKTVQELLEEAIISIRENIRVKESLVLTTTSDDATRSRLVGYVHGKAEGSNGTAGTSAALVRVGLTNADSETNLDEIGKKLAMHVVAAKPQYMDPSGVPEEVLEKEKEIVREQMGESLSNKPPEIAEKIVSGKLRKFFEENCLLEQAHMVEEGNPKVQKALESEGATVLEFHYKSIN